MRNIVHGDSTEVMNDLDRIYRISGGLWLLACVNPEDVPRDDNELFKFSDIDKYHLMKGMIRFCMRDGEDENLKNIIKKAAESALW